MQYLTSLEERLELLEGLGLEVVAPLTFTSELAELSPRAFVSMLRDTLDLRLLVMGPDNAFGRNREATPEGMKALGEELGFDVEVMPAPLTSSQESVVSATAIRRALQEGDLPSVTRQLGRYYSIRGPVVGGERRGRELGFPTANIAVTADRALPAFGVYATWAYLHLDGDDEKLQSATSIGVRPHFDGDKPSVETYIFDFNRDIYDQILRIELVEHLRPELKFESLEGLLEAMHGDVARSREILTADAQKNR
jgi:riboflavin kinase/FMN adenylyltransferase